MLCPSCQRPIESVTEAQCPHCGAKLMGRSSGVVKSSVILISAGGLDGVYRSVEEVPLALRGKLQKTTNGLNSATILIADRRGRTELARALRRIPRGTSENSRSGQFLTQAQYRWISWAVCFLALLLIYVVLTKTG